MKQAITLILIVFGLLLARAAKADTNVGYTGMELKRDCTANHASTNHLICLAYLRAFQDALLMDASQSVCFPRDVSETEQLRLVVTKFMTDHPERLNESAAFIAFFSFLQAFPCKTK